MNVDKPHKTRHHVTRAASLNVGEIRATIHEVEGFNAKLAVVITGGVGTMACAYLFAILTLLRLPSAIEGGLTGPNGVIVWFAQTFLQLVLLSIILVGQRVQAVASDARAEHEFNNTVAILDALDVKTAGGLTDLQANLTKSISDLRDNLIKVEDNGKNKGKVIPITAKKRETKKS